MVHVVGCSRVKEVVGWFIVELYLWVSTVVPLVVLAIGRGRGIFLVAGG